MTDSAVSHAHHVMDAMLYVLLFFALAGLVIPLLQRFKISPVLGYLLSGIVVGPFGLATLSDDYPWLSYFTVTDLANVQLLGEIGIITLMFMIGLELSLQRLAALRRFIFGLGTLQIVVTTLLIFLVARAYDNSVTVSLLIGASLALSSTAIVMKLLEEKRLIAKPEGMYTFSILLMQDLAVVPILVLLASFAGGQEEIHVALLTALVTGVVTVGVFLVFGKKLLRPLLNSISLARNPEWLTAFVIFLIFSAAIVTQSLGLSLALGAFLVGLLISETEFRHEVEVILLPLKSLLLGVFFLSIGMMIDFSKVLETPFLFLMSVVGIYVLKAAVILGLCRLFKMPKNDSVLVSLYLAQPGEFALMILSAAMALSILPQADGQFFILVVALAMMGTPILFKLAELYKKRIVSQAKNELAKMSENQAAPEMPEAYEYKVIIAGLGRAGMILADVLSGLHIPYLAIDTDAKRVQTGLKNGYNVIYGDVRRAELWSRLKLEHIELVVIAIDQYQAVQNIIKSILSSYPTCRVIARAKDMKHLNDLYDQGATAVVAELQESSLRMAEHVMRELAYADEEIQHAISSARAKDIYAQPVKKV
jgi:CPA2 family monovalent cation:H+ antiporter-2